MRAFRRIIDCTFQQLIADSLNHQKPYADNPVEIADTPPLQPRLNVQAVPSRGKYHRSGSTPSARRYVAVNAMSVPFAPRLMSEWHLEMLLRFGQVCMDRQWRA